MWFLRLRTVQVIFLFLVFNVFNAPVILADAIEGHFEFEWKDKSELEKLIKDLHNGDPFVLDSKPEIIGPEGLVRTVWKGNRPRLSADVVEVSLNFKREPEVEGQEPESYQVKILFQEGRVVVINTRPAYRKYIGGIRVKPSPYKSTTIFYRGRRESGIVFSVLRIGRSPVRGLLICPRDFAVDPESGALSPELRDTGYRLAAVSYKVSGSAGGELLSGLGNGLARAVIRTTPNIPAGYPVFDQAFAKDPYVALEYLASEEEVNTALEQDGSSVGAVEAILELHNSAGYHRVTSLRSIAKVSPLEFKYTLEAMREKGKITMPPGYCVGVIKEQKMFISYDRTKLIPPEKTEE
ncbi:MAG: hypothetical protein D6719_04000 [Candidatus Dadabacteria bacterium]|nr:MAG: hypothetical protein D6719_04000 [Candidatus Dadabacteria bacterium]